MPYRSRKEYTEYKQYTLQAREAGGCEFCKIIPGNDQFVEETKSFKVIKNIFPYSYWDNKKVADHMMIVPKKHTDTLSNLTNQEAAEFMQLMGSYEANGYDVYARAPTSSMKSVPHQHTHLIKPRGKQVKVIFYTKKPYLRFIR